MFDIRLRCGGSEQEFLRMLEVLRLFEALSFVRPETILDVINSRDEAFVRLANEVVEAPLKDGKPPWVMIAYCRGGPASALELQVEGGLYSIKPVKHSEDRKSPIPPYSLWIRAKSGASTVKINEVYEALSKAGLDAVLE